MYNNLQEVLLASGRAKALVKQILTFRRQAEQEPKPVQMKRIAKEALKFLRASLSTTIEIRQDIRSESLVLAADEPVAELNLGIVSKIDLSEIRAPFVKAAAIAGFLSGLVVIGGAALFLKISNPMAKLLEAHNM